MSTASEAISNAPNGLTDTFGWDNRMHLLDVFHEGRKADWLLTDDDDFHRDYAGLIAVARYAMNETIEYIKTEIDYLENHR